ncbi:EamA/RhaT family transporter [Streptomyces alfalfae]|uniref:Multidrug transporter n=1 Tax=Streptomyces alfalfae TaxID=1642299 RepID=A0ABM6GUF9_9ACTN|nr:DMT family transporter [Streptomyces alfalfae]APY87467.1 multidrug transporter [Streptomyces alfalfae]AYA17880.1 DMT family transporter [Streptomyces fradiae]RXX45091.1 EamA/RhaT family transporter [Streptomyces alfalfae]RZM99079.1 DMT family transporter [Streptomyces alfalfae]
MFSGPRAPLVRIAVLALLWGSGFLWIKLALDGGFAPLHLTIIRCALGAAVLLVLARSAGQRMPRDRGVWGHLVVAALLCNALPFFLFGLGEQTVDSGVAGVLNATTPLWSLAIGLMLRTERRLGPLRLAGLLLGFAGTLLIFAPWQQTGLASRGALALLAAAVSYAVAFAYMARHLVARDSAPLALSAAQLLTATGLTTLALPAAPGGGFSPTPTGIVAVGVLGTLGTGVTFHLNSRLIADEGPTAAATVGYLLPVVSVALGALVLGEDIGPRVVVGMAVVLAGVGLSRGGEGRREPAARTLSRPRPGPAASAPPSGRRS